MSSKRTRREFLEQSMLATAAALAAGSGTSVLARQAPGRVSANDTINVAIIGAGSRGGAHVSGYTGNKAMNTRINSSLKSRHSSTSGPGGDRFPRLVAPS